MTTSPRGTRTKRIDDLVVAAPDPGPRYEQLTAPPAVDHNARRRRRQRALRRVFVALLALLGIGAVVVSFTGLPAKEADPIKLLTSEATRGTARTEVAGSGTVAPAVEVELAFGDATSSASSSAGGNGATATTSAVVTALNVKVGTRVKRGTVLAVLDSTQAKLDLQAAQDTYDAAVAERDDPATTTTDGATEQVQTDEALELAVAEANVSLQQAKTAVDDTTLVSAGAGVIDAVNITKGSAPSTDSAAIVLRSASMAVTIDVAEDDISALKVGQKATVHVVALDADVTGTVTSVDATEATTDAAAAAGGSTSSVVTFPVRVQLAQLPTGLRPGMSAEVVVTTAQHADTVLVPLTAVVGSGDNARVRVPGADGAIEQQSVTLGLLTAKTAEVTAGIEVGDEVVTGIVQKKATTEASTSALGGATQQGGGFGGPGAGGFGGAPPGGGNFGGAQRTGTAGAARG